MGRKHSEATKEKLRAIAKTRLTPEHQKMARSAQVGDKHPRWNPNKSTDAVDRMLFNTYVSPLVKLKDKFVCWVCEGKGGDLRSHHIKPFSVCPDLRFSFVNTVTLCDVCHRALHASSNLNIPEGARLLWKFLKSQLTTKTQNALEANFINALRAYRDILVSNQGDITAAWKALDAAHKAYRGQYER